MGLDMWLEGKEFLWSGENDQKLDGFRIKEVILELGYWRKHPNLHGFIVETFAEGVDECQEISLQMEDLQKTLAAVKADKLPKTDGFFFGVSDASDRKASIEILERGIEWLGKKKDGVSKSVVYQASW